MFPRVRKLLSDVVELCPDIGLLTNIFSIMRIESITLSMQLNLAKYLVPIYLKPEFSS